MNFAGFLSSSAYQPARQPSVGRLGQDRPFPLDRRGPPCRSGLLLIAMVADLFGMICAGALYMAGNAIGSSTTLAFAVERADPKRRGKAMATFSMAYPLSYGLGSLLIGSAVESAGYAGMYLIFAALQAVGLILMLLYGARVEPQGQGRSTFQETRGAES
jgi:MFS family permease